MSRLWKCLKRFWRKKRKKKAMRRVKLEFEKSLASNYDYVSNWHKAVHFMTFTLSKPLMVMCTEDPEYGHVLKVDRLFQKSGARKYYAYCPEHQEFIAIPITKNESP